MNQKRSHIIESYVVIWLDENLDENNENYQNNIAELRGIVNEVKYFRTGEECIQYLNECNQQRVFVISSEVIGQHVVQVIHDISNVDTIYILYNNKTFHNGWIENWRKIKGLCTSIEQINQELRHLIKINNQNSMSISIMNSNEENTKKDFHQLKTNFMHFQIFKEIFLEMKSDEQIIKDLVVFCKKEYNGNIKEMEIIDEFDSHYEPSNAIWWYTRECFLYKMFNGALRTFNGDIIIRLRFFLFDLQKQIETLYKTQTSLYQGKTFLVYRGQSLLTTVFDQLVKTKDGLICFNHFLSTSTKRDISFRSAEEALESIDVVGVLFEITVDCNVPSAPFASIQQCSYMGTDMEILFSMNSFFRIVTIRKLDKDRSLYQVQLRTIPDDDKKLCRLKDCIRKQASSRTGWKRLGELLFAVGQLDKAEAFYSTKLEQAPNDSGIAHIYHQLGWIKRKQGKYAEAISYLQKSLDMKRKIFAEDHSSLISIYGDMAAVFKDMGDYSKTLEIYEKVHQILEKTPPLMQRALTTYYNNMGVVYKHMGDYWRALDFYEKALQRRKTIMSSELQSITSPKTPSIKPYKPLSRATTCGNIAKLHTSMGDYSEALVLNTRALKLKQSRLYSNHPLLPNSLDNIGTVYKAMVDYSKALEFYEQALKIREAILPSNHPSLAISYSNIGEVYSSMGNYSKALEFNEKALQLRESTLPLDHSSLANSYNNIGTLHKDMGNYAVAFEFYQKALELRKTARPLNHSNLAVSYYNIGKIYQYMGDSSIALQYYKDSSKNFAKVLSQNHSSSATHYDIMGSVYKNLHDYPKALESYTRAFKIRSKTLAPNHPSLVNSYNCARQVYSKMHKYSKADEFLGPPSKINTNSLSMSHSSLAISYNNLGVVNANMGYRFKALELHKKALRMKEKNLPSNHPDLATSYNNIATVYKQMGNYSEALECYEEALKIRQNILPSNHPLLATSYSKIGAVYNAMGDYSKALEFYGKGLELRNNVLQPNHPSLANSYNSIGTVYKNMDDYSKALSFLEKALVIQKEILPPSHSYNQQLVDEIDYVKSHI